jgi:P4 family phage/plasmid primase-like protien
LKNHQIKSLFTFNQNNNNNFNIIINESGEISSDKIKIDPNSVIFDDKELNKLMLESLGGADSDIARVIFYLCKGRFNCTQDKKWYEFIDHRWQESECINLFIFTELISYYNKVIKFINDANLEKADKLLSIKEVKKVTKLLKTKSSIGNIVEISGLLFRNGNKKFYDNLDITPYLLGFDNGVYDLEKMEFRDGRPEDMISMSCGYNFIDKYSKYKKELDKFIDDILPNKDDREYLLTYLSSGLIGLNISELFTILTGKGRNGKSKFVDLVASTIGDYFGRPKCKLLTGSRPDENAPEPGLLSLRKKRIIIVTEPEKGDKLNSGFIKFITGNDTETLRKCHKNEMEMFKANFITLLVCNDIPDIDNIDIAFAKRLRCVNYPTEFTANPKLEHQKQIDETLQLKIPKWKNDFMLMLIEYLKTFKKGKLKPSKNVLEWTEMYKDDVDKYLTFLNDCTEESETHVSNVDLYEAFKNWFKDKYPGDKVPNNRDFVSGIRKHKNVEKGVWINNKSTPGIKHLKLIDDEN